MLLFGRGAGMTYSETLDFLFGALPVWERVADGAAYKPGTERVEQFARAAGVLPVPFPTVHVAGTNGKGSTASMLAAVLQSAGYKAGLYTSPHLIDFRERIRVNGEMIPQGAVVEFAEQFRGEMVRLGMTFFEMATVMALWHFARQGVDVAVIETGLGGRFDATNIITPVLSVITNIGLEHTRYLGDTIEQIAREKAGIIKAGVPVVVGERDPESERVFRTVAEKIVFADSENNKLRITNYELQLQGRYQQKNLATVLAAVELLRERFDIPDEAVRVGLGNTAELTGLRGRWEVVGERPKVVCDTAHNAHGFRQVVRQLRAETYDRLFMVLGFAADKDVDAIVDLLPADAHIILTQADSPRAMSVEELAEKFSHQAATRNLFRPDPVHSEPPSKARHFLLRLLTARYSLAAGKPSPPRGGPTSFLQKTRNNSQFSTLNSQLFSPLPMLFGGQRSSRAKTT